MADVMVNYWAVLVAAIVSMVIGFVWYGPLFGKTWMKLSGHTPKDMEKAKKKGMGKSYALMIVSTLVMSYVLAHFVDYAGAVTAWGGVVAGVWIWLGFIATVTLGKVLWEGKPWSLWVLDNAHYLVSLAVMGAILAVWV